MRDERLKRFYPYNGEYRQHHLSKTEPLTIEMMQEIVQERSPLDSLSEICTPYELTEAITLIEPSVIESCIDDRPRIIKAIPVEAEGESVTLQDKHYQIEHLSEMKMTSSATLGSRPWPGGRYGVDMMMFVASMQAGEMPQQPFWQLEGEQFITEAIKFITDRSNTLLGDIRLPIHIDNDHGLIPLFRNGNKVIEPHCGNITQLLNSKKGCGAHQHSLEVIFTLLSILDMQNEADELVAKCNGWFDDNNIARVPDGLLHVAGELLYDNAVSIGSPVDIVIGPHDPHGTVFSSGNNTLNRRFVEAFINPTQLLFKADVGIVNNPQSLAAQIGNKVTNQYGDNVFNLEQFVVGINFATLGVLGQQKLARYLIA